MTKRKTKTIHIRLTEDEYSQLLRKAKFVEGITISQYVHNLLFPPAISKEKDVSHGDTNVKDSTDW